MIKQKNGFGYVRVSTGKQEELSPESQRKLLNEYAKSNKIHLLKIYFEIGISGRKADKRQQFQKMIGAAKSKEHPVDVILVWKFSRFARNQEESIVYKSLLKKDHNVDVISVSEPLAEGPFGSLIERIIEWTDEYYSIRLSGEVTRGMTERAMRGGYQACPPLGYKIIERQKPPVIVPAEAKIIKLIFDLYVNHKKSFFEIAMHLNVLGLTTARGNEFERRSIEYIIQNPLYCGMIRWNRTENETNRIKDKKEWVVAQGHHVPIISKEIFEEAQKISQSTSIPRRSRPSASYTHWLSGILKCPACGRTMTAKHIRSKAGQDYVYFSCYGNDKGSCMAKNSVSSLRLESAVLDSLKKILKTNRITYRYTDPVSKETVNEQALLSEQLLKTNDKEQRIKEAYRNGIDTLEEYRQNKELISQQRETITQKIKTIKRRKAPIQTKCHNVYELLISEDFDIKTKNELLKSVIEKIIYDKEKENLKIYYLSSFYRSCNLDDPMG